MAREAAMKLSAKQASGAIGNRLGRTGKDYIVRESGPCMGKSLAELARENLPALQRLARTTQDGELLSNLAQYREQWRKGERCPQYLQQQMPCLVYHMNSLAKKTIVKEIILA